MLRAHHPPRGRYLALLVLALLLSLGAAFLYNAQISRAITVSAPANATISADTAANASAPAYTALGDIVFQTDDTLIGPSGYIRLDAPSGWQFPMPGAPIIQDTAGLDCVFYQTDQMDSVIFFFIDEFDCPAGNELRISGVEVQPANGATTVSGNMTVSAFNGTVLGAAANVGLLTITPGALASFSITDMDLTTVSNKPEDTLTTILFRAFDQFGNLATGYVGSATVNLLDGSDNMAYGSTLNGLQGPFVAGQLTVDYTFPDPILGLHFVASDGIPTGSSAQFDVTAAAATTTTLTTAPNPSAAGQSVTLTATVASATSGDVEFFDGATSLGTFAVNSSGVATMSTSALSVGSHTLTANYLGNASFAASTDTHTHVVTPPATTTTLTAAPAPSVSGQSVTLTATVASATSGVVEFFDGATLIGSWAVNSSGVATMSTSALSVGSHTLRADYLGNASFAASTDSEDHVVNRNSPMTVVTAPATVQAGTPVDLVATLTPMPDGSTTPTGSVSFYEGSTLLGSATLNSSGVATLNLPGGLTVGSHWVRASYGGSSETSQSDSVSVMVVASLGGSLTVVSGPSNAPLGGPIVLTATVDAVSPATGTPAGTVSFFDGDILLDTVALVDGVATLATSSTVAGSHTVTAVYSGDGAFAGGESAAITVVVDMTSSAVTLSASSSSAPIGVPVIFTADIFPTEGTGTVTFMDGSTVLGGVPVVDGSASFSATFTTPGGHSITAVYSGDASFTGSTSAPVTVEIDRLTTSTSLSVSGTHTVGHTIRLSSSVLPAGATGTVTFMDGSTVLGTVTLVGGAASFDDSTLSIGAHSLTAYYSGDATHAPSGSSVVLLTIGEVVAPALPEPATTPSAQGPGPVPTTVPTTVPTASPTPVPANPATPTTTLPSNTTSGSSAVGDMTLGTTTLTGFAIGDTITINPGGANEESVVITGFAPLTFATALLNAHLAGERLMLSAGPASNNSAAPTPLPPATGTGLAGSQLSGNALLFLAGIATLCVASGTTLALRKKS